MKSVSVVVATAGLITLGQAAQATTLSFSSSFGSPGTGNGEFDTPIGVAVNPTSGNVYVADASNNRIQVLSSNSTAVPFEFSPGLGIMALGACGVIDQLRRKVQTRKSKSKNTWAM